MSRRGRLDKDDNRAHAEYMSKNAPTALAFICALSLWGCNSAPLTALQQYQAAQSGTLEGEQTRLNALRAIAETPNGSSYVLSQIDSGYLRNQPVPPANPTLAVWSEFIPYADVKATLPQLKTQRLALFLAVPASKVLDESLYELLSEARTQGVEVRPWLLLSPSDGYWANKWNYEAVRRHTRNFLSALDAHQVSVSWLILDVEPPAELNQEMMKYARQFNLIGLHHYLVEKVKSASLEDAERAYSALLDEVHSRGIRLHAVTNPMVLDDVAQGRSSIQAALGLPIQGVAWDEVSFMAYRPEFARMVGECGSDIVYRYACDAVRYFGNRVRMDLGEVGTIGYPDPVAGFTLPEQLKQDLGAAYAGGIKDMAVYSLDGINQQGKLSDWMNLPVAQKPKREVKAALMRYFLGLASKFIPEN